MLKIRLQRVGRKNIPTFRIVLTDSRNSTKSGKFHEILGSYDPVNDVKEVKVDRVKHWISMGAKPTDTLYNFFVGKGIISGKKINVLPRKKPVVQEKAEESEKSAVPISTETEPQKEEPVVVAKPESKSAPSETPAQ